MAAFDTVYVVITGEAKAQGCVSHLLHASQWFEVTPWPDDQWVVAVKAENSHLLPSLPLYRVARCPRCD